MILTPYTKDHILPLLDQPINANIRASYLAGMADAVAESPSASVLNGVGAAMVCGGVIKMWEGRGYVWTVFNEEAKHCFVPVFRNMRRFLRQQLSTFRRLELAVPVDFTIGHRRALLLGFKVEAPLAKGYLPNGTDCVLYSMVRE